MVFSVNVNTTGLRSALLILKGMSFKKLLDFKRTYRLNIKTEMPNVKKTVL